MEQVGVGRCILPTPKTLKIDITGLGVVGGDVVAPKVSVVGGAAADKAPPPGLIKVKVPVRLDVAANRRFPGFDVVGVPFVDARDTSLKCIGALQGPFAIFAPEHNTLLAREYRRDGGVAIGRDPYVVGSFQP